MKKEVFDEHHVLHELKHYLPTQTPLKDFIHHNSLHAFQQMKFYDAIFKASKIFGYQVTLPLVDFRNLYQIGRIDNDVLERVIEEKKGKGNLTIWKQHVINKNYDEHNAQRVGLLRANWKKIYQIELDNLIQPFLFRVLAGYLDQGVSIWDFPAGNMTFLESVKWIERESFTSFFKTAKAKKLLFQNDLTITDLLKIVVGKEEYFEQYLFDQQFSHRGWSGMVATLEARPDALLSPKAISLNDLIIFELLLEIDHLENELGRKWKPLCESITQEPIDLFKEVANTELHEVLKIWQDAFEWSYYDEVLAGIQQLSKSKQNPETSEPVSEVKSFQAMFCIDEREDSIRRHVEFIDKKSETWGSPGFFGVEFYFQAEHAKFYDKLCPAPVTPAYLIKEYDVSEKRNHDILYTNKTHQLISGFISAFTFGFWAGIRLVQNLFKPKMSPAISNAFAHMNEQGKLTIENKNINDKENGLQIGFTIEEITTRVRGLLNGIGLKSDFAPLIYVVAHGSSSA
ncbi:MAG TPA: Na-translocating system protein MpsB, partial [Bacteroidia bacterium]|nr:Na-translocating system protein MpsB [Bacteroidia bacterium]